MIERFKDNFMKGVEKLRWFATVFSERLRIEIAVMRLLYRSSEMNRRRDELFVAIGRRVYEFRENPERSVLKDKVVQEAVIEIERVEREMEDLRHRVSEMSGAGI